jgi:hypothetical protein
MPIPGRAWGSISIDFITDLPLSDGYNTIMVVVDRLTKMSHFVPCLKTITSEQTAELLMQHVVRLHGIPDETISDRGPQFVAKYYKRLMELLGVNVKLSSAFHPQTDGQTERVNQVLEQYLRCMISYQQDDWSQLLPQAEFSYNNTLHVSTGISPFYANYGYHLRVDFQTTTDIVVPSAEDRAAQIVALHQDLQRTLTQAQERYKDFADVHCKEAPTFQQGDKVWLLWKNIQTTRPMDKLDYKRLGPFTILEQINPVAYRLQLPQKTRLHPVFHVSLLEPYHPSTIPGRNPPLPPPIELDDGREEYEVDEIVDSKYVRNSLQYLLKWVGYGIDEFSWQKATNVTNAPDEVRRYHLRYPHKPGPALVQAAAAPPHRGRCLRRR